MRTLHHTRKLLRRVDGKGFGKTSREDGRLAHVDLGAGRVGGRDVRWGAGGVVGGADVDEGEAEANEKVLVGKGRNMGWGELLTGNGLLCGRRGLAGRTRSRFDRPGRLGGMRKLISCRLDSG
jgi:hypothetical protein